MNNEVMGNIKMQKTKDSSPKVFSAYGCYTYIRWLDPTNDNEMYDTVEASVARL